MSRILKREILSKHDQEVLDSIFNPLELSSCVEKATTIDAETECIDIEEDTELVRKSKNLETTAVQQAENGDYEDALETFLKALAITPQRASLYNNKAQVLRLAGKDNEALNDLSKAIELSSQHQLRTRCHAFCQRGVLQRKFNNLDAAREDFQEAASLGSKFAKSQLVEINPFAALCNQMLRQAFDKLQQTD